MENIKSIILEEVKKALKEKDKEKDKKKVTKKSSIKDKLSSIKDNDDNNELSKLKTLMDIVEDEGRAYVGLAKAAQSLYKEHDYEKLKAEADRYTALADESEVKYQKLEARYNKMIDDKKAAKKKPETSDEKPEDEKKEDKKINEGIHDRDILSRPSSNPDVKPLNRSSEELGKEADSRSENMLRMKYQKQIADPKISDDELRYLLSGSGEKAFGGRPNAIEKIIKNRNKLDEGVWTVGTPQQIQNFIEDVENLKDQYYRIVGSDAVFNGLDNAIMEAEKLLANSSKMKEGKNLNERDMSKKEEKIVLKLKKSKGDFKKRYGKDAEKVMYATATKLANK
jgi:hypothetical protein